MESRVCLTEEIEEYRETKRLDEPKSHNEVPESNFMFLVEFRKKVMSFRDIVDLPPCNGSQAIRELLMMTNEELQRLYPEVVPSVPVSEMNEMSMHQGLKHFNKIKVEVDALERIKDEESKKFKSCNIHFDFDIILRIKELIVDISSGCLELALKERRR